MTRPGAHKIFEVIEETWPAASIRQMGPWTIREGRGGGKRVSAATAKTKVSARDIALAEAAMSELKQAPLFMLRENEDALDRLLEQRGYRIIDPVSLYLAPLERLTRQPLERLTAFSIWPPLAVMREIWLAGGIGPGRMDVMMRARSPKSAVLARARDRAAGVAFVAIHQDVAMVHAIEVTPDLRRSGVAINIMRAAALWAQDQGARYFSLVVTDANVGANALYRKLGLSIVGHYHYRSRQKQ